MPAAVNTPTKTLYLIRHAESEANAGGLSRPEALICLTERGQQQARLLAEFLLTLPRPPQCWCSAFGRTYETAQPFIQATGLPLQPQPLLNEFSCLDFDQIADMSGHERRPLLLAYWQNADPAVKTGQADSFEEFSQRVAAARQWLRQVPDGSFLFTHGIWIGQLMWQAENLTRDDPVENMMAFRQWQLALTMPNTAVYRWTQLADDDAFKLVYP